MLRSARVGLSIRTKIIVMVALTLLLALIMTLQFVREIVSQNILNQKLATADILTTSVLHDLKYSLDRTEFDGGQQVIAKYMTYYRIIRKIALCDAQGAITASSESQELHRIVTDPDIKAAVLRAKPSIRVTRRDWSNLEIRSVAPVLQGSRIVAALVLDLSMTDVQQTLASIDSRVTMVMWFNVLTVSVILFFVLRTTILRRLQGLMRMTGRIASGDYETPIHDESRDEIGELARAFDRMRSDLNESKQEIELHNESLKQRVEEATCELQQAYNDLRSAQSQVVLNEKMASLGVLIAGVAHEINTPVGTILNVSRNIGERVSSLPQLFARLAEESHRTNVPNTLLAECCRELLVAATGNRESAPNDLVLEVERVLRRGGIDESPRKAAILAKLNMTDPDRVTAYLDCFRLPGFITFGNSLASIAQAAKLSETSSQKIAEIVRALKYYAYSDQHRVERIHINDSIQTALVLLRNHLKHLVDVKTDLGQELPSLLCTSEVHQIWPNLLSNACDAIVERGADYRGHIEISTYADGAFLAVRITDDGIGIPSDRLGKIFDPFYTTKDIGKGTGLGLSIVSGIVKKHEGTIDVESAPGRTCFIVRLPLPVHASIGEDSSGETDKPSGESAKEAA